MKSLPVALALCGFFALIGFLCWHFDSPLPLIGLLWTSDVSDLVNGSSN